MFGISCCQFQEEEGNEATIISRCSWFPRCCVTNMTIYCLAILFVSFISPTMFLAKLEMSNSSAHPWKAHHHAKCWVALSYLIHLLWEKIVERSQNTLSYRKQIVEFLLDGTWYHDVEFLWIDGLSPVTMLIFLSNGKLHSSIIIIIIWAIVASETISQKFFGSFPLSWSNHVLKILMARNNSKRS